MATDEYPVQIIPLGGLGEFGMNTMAIRYGGDIIVIDAGLMFPRDDLLGVDIVVPDLQFLIENREKVRAVILTHAHEDHIGGLPYLLKEIPAPVYGTPLTLGFARGRLKGHGLEEMELHAVHPQDNLQLGEIGLEFLQVTHSVADSIAVAVSTPLGRIIHTGDFKFDHSPPDGRLSDYAGLSSFGQQGVLALLSDSTNSEQPGHTPSEAQVRQHLEEIFHDSSQKIVVACFASSIHRIQILLELAREFGRCVVPVGRSIIENVGIARQMGYLNIPGGVLINSSDSRVLAPDQILLLSTGSQGEPMAALSRLALGEHKDHQVDPGDTVVISARVIPGNESRISQLKNHLCRRGARIFDERHRMVHVSGHGSREDLRLMLNLTRPRFFIPIHGEYRQLYSHALLAKDTGITDERICLAETGDIITLTSDSVEVTGRADVGRRLIDIGGVAQLDEFVVRDRQHLAEEGIVLAVIAVNKSTGLIEGSPELVSRGHVLSNDGMGLIEDARSLIIATVETCSAEERADTLVLTELVRAALKRFFRKKTSTRPVIVPVVLDI
jgi:ribonuclease J